MNFELSDEHKLMREMVRDFAQNELLPSAGERDEQERFDRTLMFDRLADLGLTGIILPEEYGGAGADYLSYAIVIEELSRVCASTGVTLSVHLSLTGKPIAIFGNDKLKSKFLRPMAEGKLLGAFALTETDAGSDAGGTRTTAVLDGEQWILNGTKIFVTNGGEAEVYIIFARTNPQAQKHHGISAFVVEKETQGLTFGKKEKKLGIRSSLTLELILNDCRIPKENLLGKQDRGFQMAMQILDGGRLGIAAQALGIAQGAYEASVAYARERKQFGHPIAAFQAVGFMIADMATKIEAARLLVYQTAYRASAGLSYRKESAMAKLFASETAMQVTTDAVQVHGGYGYTKEFPVERMMRDAKITQIYEGTSEIQRLVISKAVCGDL